MSMRFRVLVFAFLATAMGLLALFAQSPVKPDIPYPEGYRSWTLVKSGVVFDKQHPLFDLMGGIHNVFVNERGLISMQRGRIYPNGSVIVCDLYELHTSPGAMETGKRRYLAVMKKDSKLYSETGGWGFEIFRGYEQKGSVTDMKPCFDCHAEAERTDYVHAVMAR